MGEHTSLLLAWADLFQQITEKQNDWGDYLETETVIKMK